MQTKHLLTMSLLMPLMVFSATAQAGATISDKRYWPSEARQSTPYQADQQRGVNSAFAYDRTSSAPQPAMTNVEGWSRPYQGGPKGR